MTTIDFSRSAEVTLIAKEGRLLNGYIDYSRSDEVAIDYSSKEVVMDVYNQNRDVLLLSLSVSGGDISVSSTQINLNEILNKTTLPVKKYYYELYNSDDQIGIGHGLFEVR